jgi:hypothetical protein
MEYTINGDTLQGIADAIREKNGSTDPMMVSEFANEIENLPTEGKGAYQYAQDGGYTGTEEEFASLLANAVDKRKITLGLHTDGLLYIFVDDSPVGNGVALPSGGVSADVYGYFDENGDVVLKGNITDGAILKLDMEDGTVIDIAEASFYHSVTNNLTYCTNSNSATEIVKGKAYNATISANSGYALKSVTVTMGGASVTVTNGVIAIEKVTGDIVITAVAEVAEPVTENLTLVAKTSIVTVDGSTRENTGGHCATDFIDVSNIPKPCTIKLEGAGWAYTDASATGYVRFYVENVSGTKLVGDYTHPSKMPNGVTMTCSGSMSSNGNNYIDATITVTSDNIGKLRFAGMYTVVTPNAFDASVTKATLTYTPST